MLGVSIRKFILSVIFIKCVIVISKIFKTITQWCYKGHSSAFYTEIYISLTKGDNIKSLIKVTKTDNGLVVGYCVRIFLNSLVCQFYFKVFTNLLHNFEGQFLF